MAPHQDRAPAKNRTRKDRYSWWHIGLTWPATKKSEFLPGTRAGASAEGPGDRATRCPHVVSPTGPGTARRYQRPGASTPVATDPRGLARGASVTGTAAAGDRGLMETHAHLR